MLSRVKYRIEQTLTAFAKRLPPYPNMYTLVAVLIAMFIPVAPLYLSFRVACIVMAILLAFSSLMDMVDGLVARAHSKVTKVGAFLDSTCDRVVDFLAILGLYLLIQDNMTRLALVCLLFMSSLISYARARAESLGTRTLAGIGLMERPERIIAKIVLLIMLAVLPDQATLIARFYILAMLVLAIVTAVHRCVFVVKSLKH